MGRETMISRPISSLHSATGANKDGYQCRGLPKGQCSNSFQRLRFTLVAVNLKRHRLCLLSII